VGDRMVLVEHDDDGKIIGTVYHNITCLESGWVNGAMHGKAPIHGHYRAMFLDVMPSRLKACSHCGG
jgi:hypothetical protein